MSRLPSTITLGQRQVDLGLTAADHLVNWFSPAAGQRRLEARARVAMLSGGYASADKTRRANQARGKREMDADSAIVPDLTTLREDSQHLARNNALAGGALKTNITKVVGTGLRVKARVDRQALRLSDDQADAWERAAEREFLLATETREIDLERELPFSLLQGLAFLRVLEDGDLVVNLPRVRRPGSPYTTRLELIEAARICNPEFGKDTDTLIAGVQKDAYGAPELFHVCNRHPARRWKLQGGKPVDLSWRSLRAFAQDGTPLALHLKDKMRPGQTRGVPYLAPVIELIKQLGRYTDAEVMAAVVSGMLTVFVYNDSGNPEFGPAATQTNPTGDPAAQVDATGLELGYGSVLGLRDGQRVETVNPGRPNTAFDPFFVAIARQIGMCLELPFEVLLKHFTASYSAARAALLDAWDYFFRRRHWLASQFCQPIYEVIITEAVVFGRLAAPGFLQDPLIRRAWLGTRWDGDAPGEIDPVKAVEAASKRVDMYLTTLDQEYAEMIGGDHESIQPQIVKERSWIKENGLAQAPATPVTPPAPAQPDQPDTEDDK
jgi:lambda family phage portal protein